MHSPGPTLGMITRGGGGGDVLQAQRRTRKSLCFVYGVVESLLLFDLKVKQGCGDDVVASWNVQLGPVEKKWLRNSFAVFPRSLLIVLQDPLWIRGTVRVQGPQYEELQWGGGIV